MNPEPYRNEQDDRQNGGASAWQLIALAVWTVLLLIVLHAVGCSSLTINRNAPLINVQDSANGNTVPVSAVP